MKMDALKEIRRRAQKLANRAKVDQALKEQLQQDPEATLAAAGIPEDMTAEFLQASGIEAEVSGYLGHMKHICVLSSLM